VRLPHDLKNDPFPGSCPFHMDCFEGLASGPALARRWGKPAETLPDDHPAWDLEATYIAYAILNIILTLSPQRIVLGGGVMQQPLLFPLVRNKVRGLLNGYPASPVLSGTMEEFILPPGLGKHSGVLGALALALQSE
jgi:fructokinase